MVRARAFRRDAFREIRRTLPRFIAIVAIVALGTAFFVGIKTTNPDMKATAANYFAETGFYDFRLLSNVGFTEADVEALRGVEGVTGVQPADSLDAVVRVGSSEKVFRVESLPDADGPMPGTAASIDRPHVVAGRLPTASGECVVERNTLADIDYAVGDRIHLTSGDGSDLAAKIATADYTVVGIVETPEYVSKDRGTTTIGNGVVSSFVLVPLSDFRQTVYSGVYVAMANPTGARAYSAAYDDLSAVVKVRLDALSAEQAPRRTLQILSDAWDAWRAASAEYDRSAYDARQQMSDAWAKIADGQAKVDDGRAQLAAAEKSAAARFASAGKDLAAGRAAWQSSETSYEANRAAFDAAVAQAKQLGDYDAQKPAFDARQAQLDAAQAQLAAGKAALDAQVATLAKSKRDAAAAFAATKATLDASQSDLDQGKKDYATQKADADQKLADGYATLMDGRAKLDDLPTATWYVLDRSTNVGYVDYGAAADRLDAIARVFPVLFVLVAMLICFASMSRMVEEQRTYMGTLKSLGYSRLRIASKFLLYAFSASVLGAAAGLYFGFEFFPPTIYHAYSALYTIPNLVLLFDGPFAAAALAAGVAVTCGAALLVAFEELASTAATLMRPRAPKPGRVILLERIRPLWRRMSFTWKVTARNILRYRARFLMTVVGVGGCTALLLVGFGLRDAVKTIVDEQYGSLFLYQATVTLQDGATDAQRAAVKTAVEAETHYAASLDRRIESVTVSAGDGGVSMDASLLVPADPAGMAPFIVLRDRVTQASIVLGDEGVVLTEKLAGRVGLKAGDAVTLTDADGKSVRTKVTAVTENYLRHFVYMTPSLYARLYGSAPVDNSILVDLTVRSAEAQQTFSKTVVTTGGISSVVLTSDNVSKFDDSMKSIYSIVLVLIFSAGLLSFIVLYTLTDINITERTREIATIKVLGFFDREVASYIFRENLVLTLAGVAAGLLAGSPLSHYVIGSAEVDLVMFGRRILPASFAEAAALTLAFSLAVTFAMVYRLRRIDMIEALKTSE